MAARQLSPISPRVRASATDELRTEIEALRPFRAIEDVVVRARDFRIGVDGGRRRAVEEVRVGAGPRRAGSCVLSGFEGGVRGRTGGCVRWGARGRLRETRGTRRPPSSSRAIGAGGSDWRKRDGDGSADRVARMKKGVSTHLGSIHRHVGAIQARREELGCLVSNRG